MFIYFYTFLFILVNSFTFYFYILFILHRPNYRLLDLSSAVLYRPIYFGYFHCCWLEITTGSKTEILFYEIYVGVACGHYK